MTRYIIRRLVYMIPTLFAISIVSFVIIKLPPGNYLTTLVAQLASQGESIDPAQLESLKQRYGLDQPIYVQYWLWMSNILLHGDFGYSFEWNRPVADLLWQRMPLSMFLSLATLIFVWAVSLPIGIYSAIKQYSATDYVMTLIGFVGLAIPNFMIALILAYIGFTYFGQSVGGLFSPQYVDAGWNLGKVLDFLSHLWIPMIVIGTAGTAGTIRIIRANLLDEKRKPYVVTARAKGLPEWRLILRYPVRVALNPFFSSIGWVLPGLISGEVIVSQVLSLDTTGPLLVRALLSLDMYLAGSFILLLSVLTVVGTLISDIVLAWVDPRIRYRYS